MIYSRTYRTLTTSSGAPALELVPGTRSCKLMAMDIQIINATASQFQLGRPAAVGVTPTLEASPYTYHAPATHDALASVAMTWGTPPTAPSADLFRKILFPATALSLVQWRFAEGLDLWTSLVLWTYSSVSVADVTIEIWEP